MSRATPDQIIAHVALLRAVDRLLADAESVREKREVLDLLLEDDRQVSEDRPSQAATEPAKVNRKRGAGK